MNTEGDDKPKTDDAKIEGAGISGFSINNPGNFNKSIYNLLYILF